VTFAGGKVQVDVDGNGKADFHIKMIGIDSMAKGDFIL
jgi:hypothetical protein